jgi:hypothetical protein
MNWLERWGMSLLVVLAPIVIALMLLVPKLQLQYERFSHITHKSDIFGCEPLGKVANSSELKLAYEKGANATTFRKSNGVDETYAYFCDRSFLQKLFAVIKPKPEFAMPRRYISVRSKRKKPEGSTWVAMLGEEVLYRNGQRKFEVRSWTLEQRTKKVCQEFIQSVRGDAVMTACIPMEEYSAGKVPWWVNARD